MVISDKIRKAINKQINAEMYSAYLYLAMAAHFETKSLLGAANWFKAQFKEENAHAMKFYEYVLERGGRVELADIEAPKSEWKSLQEAFTQVYAHELKVTGLINDLMKLAKSENDYATESLLKWFVDEQIEEEANASMILEKLKMIKDSANGILMLDHELGERK